MHESLPQLPAAAAPVVAPIPPAHDSIQRDAEILRLWDAKLSATKIAHQLGIKPYTVGYILRKNGRRRRPKESGAPLASVEVRRQADWPDLSDPDAIIHSPVMVNRCYVAAGKQVVADLCQRYGNDPLFLMIDAVLAQLERVTQRMLTTTPTTGGSC
jgi:DNA-binding CsgD family transcriptional regulator